MGKVLTTGAGSIECEASISCVVSPNRLKTRTDGYDSQVLLPSAARGHCNISYISVFSAYIH
jgi:hypothetical protein